MDGVVAFQASHHHHLVAAMIPAVGDHPLIIPILSIALTMDKYLCFWDNATHSEGIP